MYSGILDLKFNVEKYSLLNWLIVISLASSCSSPTTEWGKIKKSQNIYPKDSIISFKSLVFVDSAVTWINVSYGNYPYKKYCRQSVEVTFKRPGNETEYYIERDSLQLAKLLLNEFRKKGVAHFAGQTLSSDELVIYFYTEEGLNSIGTVSDFKIANSTRIGIDENWKSYSSLLKENSSKH